MNELFDAKKVVKNSELILVNGSWPSFNNAEVHHFYYWKGDARPDDNVWIGPDIVVDFEITVYENPFFVRLKFINCDDLDLLTNNPDNMMSNLKFSFEARGNYTNGDPLPPYILVDTIKSLGFHLKFKCFEVEVLERYEEKKDFNLFSKSSD